MKKSSTRRILKNTENSALSLADEKGKMEK